MSRRSVAIGILIGYMACLAVTATIGARAHLPVRVKAGAPLAQREKALKADLRHARFVAAVGHGKPRRSHARAARWLASELADVQAQLAAITLYVPPAIRQAFLCIHRYEGSWTDPNPPHWGGLQFDLDFQRTYGPELLRGKGTADHWTPAEQIHVAYRAYRGYAGYGPRGFYPWPNTARYCGLI